MFLFKIARNQNYFFYLYKIMMINFNVTFLGNLILYECTKCKLLCMNDTYFIYRYI